MALPVYSKTLPVPPPMPMRAISARMMSLAETPGAEAAFHLHLEGLRLALQQALRGQHVLDLAGADAESQRAECAVGGGVAVAADHGHAGLRESQFGADHVHDALLAAVHAQAADAELAAVGFELIELFQRDLIEDGQRAVRGGNAVVGGGDGEIGTPHLEAALAQALEGLGRRHLMDQVQVDEEQGRSAGALVDYVRVPEFFFDNRGRRRRKGLRRGRQDLPHKNGRARNR